jgi:hypothetical protein
MKHGLAEGSHPLRIEVNLGMDPSFSISTRITSEQANDSIVIPAATYDAVAKKMI